MGEHADLVMEKLPPETFYDDNKVAVEPRPTKYVSEVTTVSPFIIVNSNSTVA